MKYFADRLTFSPTDLIHFMDSEFITWMDRYHLEYPDALELDADDESLAILSKKGLQHEHAYLASLKAANKDVYEVPSEDAEFCTLNAMKDGREIIYQAALSHQQFRGFSDFLIKRPGPSNFGDYYYEPWDTKLALKAKPYYIIQLCCYAEILQAIQGVLPPHVSVVLGSNETQEFRTQDFFYYYKQLKESFLLQQQTFDPEQRPMPNGLDGHGRWSAEANKVLEEKDHIGRVANIRQTQIKKLAKSGITTLNALADLSNEVHKMEPSTLAALKDQARIQRASIGLNKPEYEILRQTEINPRRGLATLPPASPNDVWFDMEGYPHMQGGLEYLFGATYLNAKGELEFIDWWAHDRMQEREAFENFVDWVHGRWTSDRSMHIYHYASYEVSAMRKLMGRFGTREDEVDDLLRNEVFVDLYRIVQQGLRVGEPRYSLKNIEHLYMEKRGGDVAKATDSIVFYERWLEQQDGPDHASSKILRDIRDYNKIDCDSTQLLTEWLRKRQSEVGIAYIAKPAKADEKDAVGSNRPAAILAKQLLSELDSDQTANEESRRLKELLAHLLEFHHREEKPLWWAMFDRHGMTEQQLIDDLDCLGGLRKSTKPITPIKNSRLVNYLFDAAQDTKLSAGKPCYFAHDLRASPTIHEIDLEAGATNLKFGPSITSIPERLSLIPKEVISADIIAQSILRQVESWHKGSTLTGAIEDFLLRKRPNIKGNASGPILDGNGEHFEQVTRAVLSMSGTTLCIQGPPGTGKTFTAAHAIAALIAEGKVVGVSSNSHRVIAKLLDESADRATKNGVRFAAAKVQSEPEKFHVTHRAVQQIKTIDDVFASGQFDLIGGTAWAFSNVVSEGKLDYLFVDEAGQVSVANLLGMAACAKNIVLIGDQMQLSQPIQGSHPGESGKSCLEYLLQDKQTVPEDFGIFLGLSYRMHPGICQFISDSVYEGRLYSHEITKSRLLEIPPGNVITKTAGIFFHAVDHEGNIQHSEEEVSAIGLLIQELLNCSFTSAVSTAARRLSLADILVVAPYNMQVRALQAKLPNATVGTVDKFQGQEAPIVIISMCASDAGDSPRGLEFLLSKNRMNVAVSRAQTLTIVVGSPRLANTSCGNLEQLELVNMFCRLSSLR